MLGFITDLLTTAVSRVDETLEGTPPHQIILATAALYFAYNHYPTLARTWRSRNAQTYQQTGIDLAYRVAQRIPFLNRYVRQEVDKELAKNLESTRQKIAHQRRDMTLDEHFPQERKSVEAILANFGIPLSECSYDFASIQDDDSRRQFAVQTGDGRDSGALYAVHPEELRELLKLVYEKTELSNPLHDKWPRISAMQAEIVHWCQEIFHGSKEGYGLLTHGGTTSIIEAMSAYVRVARQKGVEHPEIVVPETAHAAFKKAADLTGATLVVVPVDPRTGAVNASTMESYVSGNTAVIVGSAPSFMNGIHDPIVELGKLAQKKKVPFHVDACLGGFLTAFLDTSDDPMDFRVPGVTSVSADLHKYGNCPKGTSICLFSKDSPALPIYAALNWQGGLYATPGILDGSTSGARVAEVYATLSYYGYKKYQEIAEQVVRLRQELQDSITTRIPAADISVFSNPKWSLLGFRSSTLNPHLIADELDKKGWKLNLLQNPDGFHFCLTHVHTLVDNFVETFTHDLEEAIRLVKQYPADTKPTGNVKVYGAVRTMPTAIQAEVCTQYQLARLAYGDQRFFPEAERASTAEPVDMVVHQRNKSESEQTCRDGMAAGL